MEFTIIDERYQLVCTRRRECVPECERRFVWPTKPGSEQSLGQAVDAVGDASNTPAEIKEYFRKQDAALTPQKLQEMYGTMLGPKAKAETRRRILASAARLDLPAFAMLRGQMGDFHAREAVTPFKGPMFAIDAEGNDSPILAAHLPGVQRRTIPGVSHWLMLDDPQAFNAALDEVLALLSAAARPGT